MPGLSGAGRACASWGHQGQFGHHPPAWGHAMENRPNLEGCSWRAGLALGGPIYTATLLPQGIAAPPHAGVLDFLLCPHALLRMCLDLVLSYTSLHAHPPTLRWQTCPYHGRRGQPCYAAACQQSCPASADGFCPGSHEAWPGTSFPPLVPPHEWSWTNHHFIFIFSATKGFSASPKFKINYQDT